MANLDSIWSWRWSVELKWHQYCFYCERPVGERFNLPKTKDHVIPISKGGDGGRKNGGYKKRSKYTTRNVVICCPDCNVLKDDLELSEFKERIEILIESGIKHSLPLPTILKNIIKLSEMLKKEFSNVAATA